MFKRFVNILLILVLLVTVLPLKQVGRMLFDNQWTEEISEHSDQGPEKKSQPAKWTFLGNLSHEDEVKSLLTQDLLHNSHFSQTLPINPSGEIHSPPPNRVQ